MAFCLEPIPVDIAAGRAKIAINAVITTGRTADSSVFIASAEAFFI
jgi:hypothetical protein